MPALNTVYADGTFITTAANMYCAGAPESFGLATYTQGNWQRVDKRTIRWKGITFVFDEKGALGSFSWSCSSLAG